MSAPTPEPMPRVLIADDHEPTRHALQSLLEKQGYRVLAVATGAAARDILTGFDPPALALLDWMMPEMTGVELCRAVRALNTGHYTYLIVITGRDSVGELAEVFTAGADDFIAKPFEPAEVLARLRVGERIIELEHRLATRLTECEEALERVRQLRRLLPICMFCKRVRDDADYWEEIDVYIRAQTGTDFSHGICPACMARLSLPQGGGGIDVPECEHGRVK